MTKDGRFGEIPPLPLLATSIASIRAAGFWVALSVLLLTVWFPRSSRAYVLEGPHVLELAARAMGRIGALQVNQKVTVYPQMGTAVPRVFDETAIYVMPQRFRSDITSDRIRRTYLAVADQSLTVIDGRMATGNDPYDLYQRLLRSRTRSQLMRTLNAMGVETAISSLGRVDETVVFVIGARYPDESVSQLAVDKETFFPVRLLLVGADAQAPDQHLQIYYRQWRKVQDAWFPYQVDFYHDDHLSREIGVVDLRLNPSMSATLLDLEALRASVAATQTDPGQEQKQDAVESVQKAVEEFQKKFE